MATISYLCQGNALPNERQGLLQPNCQYIGMVQVPRFGGYVGLDVAFGRLEGTRFA